MLELGARGIVVALSLAGLVIASAAACNDDDSGALARGSSRGGTGTGNGSGDGSGDGDGNGSDGSSGGSGDNADSDATDDSNGALCVKLINEHRQEKGLPPLARWKSAETCSNGEAKSDSETGKPHGAFGQCDESAQNECPGWPGTVESVLPGCLQMMIDEGPGGGHHDTMVSTRLKEVACGFHVTSAGKVWAVQNFR